MEQVLLLSDESMITSFGLRSELDVLVEFLLRGEGDGVDALKTVVGGLAEPVSSRVFHHFETLDELSGGNMRPSAQINQVAALISSHALSILNLSGDGRQLERISLEELKGFLLGEDEALELLILVCNFLGGFLNDGVILFREYLHKRRRKQADETVSCARK